MRHALILLLSVMTLSCSDQDVNENDYLVFGTYYGFCIGNCTNIYKIENGQLFKDKLERPIIEDLSFHSDPLPKNKFHIAQQLLKDLPDYFMNNKGDTLGCPNCGDQGSYIVEIRNQFGLQRFIIDPWIDPVEYSEVRIFMDKIDDVLIKITQ